MIYHHDTNPLSKQENKYAFKLLQIFGFRDESVFSFVDKDYMKFKYSQAIKKEHRLANEENKLEKFVTHFMIQNLALFRDKYMKNLEDFRRIIMQTDCNLYWNNNMENHEQKLETEEQIFDFSY